MGMSPLVWDQVKNHTVQRWLKALLKDGWERDKKSGATARFKKKGFLSIVLHIHPGKTFHDGSLVDYILERTQWTEDDLVRLKLIKLPRSKRKK